MKKQKPFYISLLIAVFFNNASTGLHAQALVDEEVKKQTINTIVQLVKDNYVFPAIAEQTGNQLQKQYKNGFFNCIARADSFGVALTKTLQSVNHDKHMRVRLLKTATTSSVSQRPNEKSVNGFSEISRLSDTVAYINITEFYDIETVKSKIDSFMLAMNNVKAFIFDLRNNRGGRPQTVQYICSYFFNDRILLNSLYNRLSNETTDYWTVEVAGTKNQKVPVYVLTSAKTFSAGEEFCYDLQTRKRATIVGEATGGGANPGRVFPVNEYYSIFIPTGMAVNPVTKTNWEGRGVQPDILVNADDALQKVLDIIRKS
jgi:retinol-binding protein 3